MKRITLLLPIVLLTSFLVKGQSLIGHYEGTITYQEAPLFIRLDIRGEEAVGDDPGVRLRSPRVALDIPQLLLAWEPVPLTADTLLSLPFGLGDFQLKQEGDSLLAANENFQLRLHHKPPFLFQKEALHWTHEGDTLRGALYLPGNGRSGPYPTVVMTHGANIGHRGRWEYRSWADFYLREGFAVLLYDRRGEGESTGETGAGFELLTEDLLAGLDRLYVHPAIDTTRIGVAGGSQAAYLGLMAASRSEAVDFLILSAVPAVPLDEQEMQMVEYGMREDGLPHEQIRKAQAYLRLLFHYVATGRQWEALRAESQPDPAEPWTEYVGFPEAPEGLQWWRDNFDAYRPAEMLPRVDIPGLYLYGETDWITPPLENAAKLEHYLSQNPDAEVTIRVFEGVGHNLERPAGKDEQGNFQWFEKHPGMVAAIRAFLKTL